MLHPYANINTRHDPTVYVTIDAGLERLAEDRTTSCDFYADVLLAGVGIATKGGNAARNNWAAHCNAEHVPTILPVRGGAVGERHGSIAAVFG